MTHHDAANLLSGLIDWVAGGHSRSGIFHLANNFDSIVPILLL